MGRTLATIAFLGYIQLCFGLQFTFTDSQIFFDLSTFNFNNGQNLSQEWSLTARKGNVIHLYLFQNNENQYNIQLFDGPDATARVIPTEGKIPSSNELIIEPVSILSSGPSMYIKVVADNLDPKTVVDFQALATDFKPPSGCSNTVISINEDAVLEQDHLFSISKDGPCYYVIHANDPTNNPLLIQNVQISYQPNSGWFSLYKGLKMDDKHKLENNDQLSTTWAYDKYFIVAPTQEMILSFYWEFMDELDINIKLWQNAHGTIMSNDYFKDSYPNQNGAMKQNMVIEKMHPVKEFQITFLNMMGPGSLTVTEIKNNVAINETVYLPSTFLTPFNVTYNCDKVVMSYSTPMRPQNGASGFYAVYGDSQPGSQ